jgi:hypothetical protein
MAARRALTRFSGLCQLQHIHGPWQPTLFLDLSPQCFDARVVSPGVCIDLLRNYGKLGQHLVHEVGEALGEIPSLSFTVRWQVLVRDTLYIVCDMIRC